MSRHTPPHRVLGPQPRLLAVSLVLAAASAAHGQWTAQNLSPPGWNVSGVYSVRGGVPVGQVEDGSMALAGYWSGDSGSSWVSLHPGPALMSSTTASSANFQSGVVFADGRYRASRWSGSAASWVDLSPAGATSSYAWGMDGDNSVGVARFGGPSGHASLWTADTNSWIDLSPAGSTSSAAFGGGGGQQVGYAKFDGDWRAVVWSGSAESYIDLHPGGAHLSYANNSDGWQQVGMVAFDAINHAALWSGSADSLIDLNPLGADSSLAADVFGGWQVGYARFGDSFTASLWNGSAESWTDLGALLQPWFSNSNAHSVWSDGVTLYVGGSAHNDLTGGIDAMVWTHPVPSPGGLALIGLSGLLASRRRRDHVA